MIKLVIADDHQLFRSGLRKLCEVMGGFQVLAEAETGLQAVTLARDLKPDVILMDIRMPVLTGVDATQQIMRENPNARVLVLTMYRHDHYITNALKAGACGYLIKDCSEATLFSAIHAAHKGEAWIDPSIAGAVLSEIARPDNEPVSLSKMEFEILRLVARGTDNQGIADALHIAKGTVANHLRAIFQTLGVNNRTEAALYALREGWATLDPED